MEKNTNSIFKIISGPISLLSLKIYYSILKKLKSNNTDRIVISPLEISIGIEESKELYKCLDELQKSQVKLIDKKEELHGSFILLSEYTKVDNGIFVAVPPSIYSALCGKSKKLEEIYYTVLKLLEKKSFKCSYSLIFYEIFKKYEKVELPTFTVEELRSLTKTGHKYKTYYDLKKRVLEPAKKEINSFDTKFIYDYKEEYFNRKVDKIKFIRIEKFKEIETDIICNKNNQGTNVHNVKEKPVKSEITRLEKLQNQEKTLEELKKMTALQGIKKIPIEQKNNFFERLKKIETKEELKKFCEEYNILLNLQLFQI